MSNRWYRFTVRVSLESGGLDALDMLRYSGTVRNIELYNEFDGPSRATPIRTMSYEAFVTHPESIVKRWDSFGGIVLCARFGCGHPKAEHTGDSGLGVACDCERYATYVEVRA